MKKSEAIKVYHNPRCRKSREALEILQSKGIEPEIIEYLKNPPSVSELKEILSKLGLKAEDIIRKNEPLYKEKYKDKKLSEGEWLKILSENPILIERPIVVRNTKAVVGRPPENVFKLF